MLDLENQAVTTEQQIDFERRNRQVYLNLARKTYIVSNAVFEDLKHSGHISTIKDPELRYALFQFYQQTDYVEAVIANNNASEIIEDQIQDDMTRFRLHNMLTFRAWINSVQERILEDLLEDNRYLIAELGTILSEEIGL